ncbi:peptidoglycan-binding domain 1 protein [Planktothrix agardhii CCAP 1459/11A]|jgi:hypothetical protein|uniref:Peptidoglycan-binding domain 1 protein n=1 Tax=Planktothrix agardhii CCAP 1459/11A TaxID=282420 RepID=A0A479ZRN4_PLAAG|nr:C39 family peptidase [Planktothrix agardhii]GCL34113.1 peptidoglycan-binding domain 1 protein [Planktothrix agardhii CCAP 1459/11A]
MQYTLQFKKDGYLKRVPLDSARLQAEDWTSYKSGTEISIGGYTPNLHNDHIRVYLEEITEENVETSDQIFYCLAEEVEICVTGSRDGGSEYPPSRPTKINLEVPYHSQLNNEYQPYGTCNVTSVAMVLKFYKVDSRTQADLNQGAQLEDQLYLKTSEWDDQYGITTRHSPEFLIRLIREYGQKYGNGILQNSYFKANATEEQIKLHLAKGNPVIVHGYFTNFGHIIVVKGYDDNTGEWICNDPYGQWLGYTGGYDTNVSGADVRYSYKNFYNACYENGIWCHFPVGAVTSVPAQTPVKTGAREMKLTSPAMEGPDVRKMQEALVKAGVSVGGDGVFGPKTEQALKTFQKQKGLPVTGIVNTATRLELGL